MSKFDCNSAANDLLILGNGFDLHLGLKSSFAHYFNSRIIKDNEFDPKCNNLLLYLMYLRFYYNKRPSNAFFRTVFNDNPNWMDIEGFIKKIATDANILDGIYDSMHFRKESALKPINADEFKILIGRFLSKLNLSDNLLEFELDFSDYLKDEISRLPDFYNLQASFILKIFSSIEELDDDGDSLQVVNFNYTKNKLNIYNEANIHGTLDGDIVIGYDSTASKIKDEDIFELSKDWRKIGIDFDYSAYNDGTYAIVVYGHSLGEQDYPYFFEIFDNCNFLDSAKGISLYFCYSKFGDEIKQRKELEKYKINAAKLLNAYERYKQPNIERNTIVTKLKIDKRLFFKEIVD